MAEYKICLTGSQLDCWIGGIPNPSISTHIGDPSILINGKTLILDGDIVYPSHYVPWNETTHGAIHVNAGSEKVLCRGRRIALVGDKTLCGSMIYSPCENLILHQ